MQTAIQDIRALLWQFQQANLRDFHWRHQGLQLFLARGDGRANPMVAAEAPALAPASQPLTAISAPHLGLFEPCVAEGDAVAAGTVLARIDVLGRRTDVVAPEAGRVAALRFAANDLVEFGEALMDLTAA